METKNRLRSDPDHTSPTAYTVAVHEAAHAVAYIQMGYGLTSVNTLQIYLDDADRWNGEFTVLSLSEYPADTIDDLRRHAKNHIVIGFAGHEAEVVLWGAAARPSHDLDRVEELAIRHGLFPRGSAWDGLLQLRARARQIVRRRWYDIVYVAEALEELESLSAVELEDLLSGTTSRFRRWEQR